MDNKNSYSLAKKTKEILKKHNIKLNKKLGQHYLIDENKRKQILDFAYLDNKDIVLEIGPGIGTLTRDIASKAKKVIAIEQDPTIFNILSENLKDLDNVEIINADALDIDFPYFNKIVSNLPYQISSPITFKFLDYDFDLAILMYQKEFVNRMIADVSTKNYSRLAAMLHFKSDIEFLTNISKESFFPKPKVDSALVRLSPAIDIEEISKDDYNNYGIFTKALFQHKNKKLRNALIDSRHVLGYKDKKEIKEILNEITSKKLNDLLSQKVVGTYPEDILYLSKHLDYIIKSENNG
ncbi:16S rRNA (adenine(1518)-N(6)/adenine(1519)-N(6))-dimethyltransferase RsmA [Methanobrevibacter sp. DSM 116169]|uniref:16S rRNA (adenine(1518)-N(6)/adenine(1519)-N(6))- dimethyltransferase RsmA n=1 Tax=Methanobrevibacter sp. DSM 116169 TaxID=3242727 RepID=UPI0038FD0DE8